jgi:hypothetical protein
MKIKISQAPSILAKFIRARLVPMLHGSPGKGKSAIIHQVAKEYNLKVIDKRLAQCDPTDMLGFPHIVNNRSDYMPPLDFPIEGDPVPEGYAGWLLFLDEMNSAPPAVQAAAYKVVLDRMVGQHKLHKQVAIVAAGNLESDNAIVQPMSTALQSRLVHLELDDDVDGWLNWAVDNGIDHRITSYIRFKPANLYAFSPDHTDKTYACNRTWEFAHRVLEVTTDGDPDRLPMLAGTLSEGVAREFLGYIRIYTELPRIDQITATPESLSVPGEPSILFALTGSMSNHASPDNIAQLLKYIKRLPVEFQVVCLRETVRRHKPLLGHAAMQDWIATSATALF